MENEIEIENRIKEVLAEVFKDLIINTKQTFDIFLKEKNPADLIALYDFYYYTAKWQKTNQPKATTKYVMKGLKWGRDKVRKNKQQLVKLKLVQDIRKINRNSKYLGWYIKINFIWGENTILNKMKTTLLENSDVVEKTTLLKKNQVDFKPPNALSEDNLNALKTNIDGSPIGSPLSLLKETNEAHKQVVELFDYFTARYLEVISDNQPEFDWGTCERLAKPYLKRFALPKMKELVDEYFCLNESWLKQHGWPLRTFLAKTTMNTLINGVK